MTSIQDKRQRNTANNDPPSKKAKTSISMLSKEFKSGDFAHKNLDIILQLLQYEEFADEKAIFAFKWLQSLLYEFCKEWSKKAKQNINIHKDKSNINTTMDDEVPEVDSSESIISPSAELPK